MVEPLKGTVIKMCDIASTMNFRGSREKFLLHSRFMNVGNVKKADFTINRFTFFKKIMEIINETCNVLALLEAVWRSFSRQNGLLISQHVKCPQSDVQNFTGE